jgi:hypothetical protein
MMGRMMIRDFFHNRKSALLKVVIPFVIVSGAGFVGYAGIGLAMLLVFTGVIGAGMSVVKLKTTGFYDRLIASPVRKIDLFLDIAGAQTLILVMQYLPSIAAAAYFSGPAIIYPAVLSLLVVVVIGIAIGTASRGLGDMHLNATLAVLPLLLATFAPAPMVRILPFHALIVPELSFPAIVLPAITLFALYVVFLAWVSRL